MFLANFNSTDPQKPSFFEMFAQQQLTSTMKPALKYVFSVLSIRNRRWEWAEKYNDEIFHSIQYLVERYYLKNYEGSFAENFYNLRRVPEVLEKTTEQITPKTGLNSSQIRSSLFFLVIVPYLKSKLDKLYQKYSHHNYFNQNNSSVDSIVGELYIENEIEQPKEKISWKLFIFKLLVTGYPFFHGFYESLRFIYQILYMHDYINYYNWFLHFQRIDVKRFSLRDLMTQQQKLQAKRERLFSRFQKKTIINLIIKFFIHMYHFTFDYSPFILPLLIFLFRFTEWWYSEHAELSQPQLPIPPPPSEPRLSVDSLPERNRCSICKDIRTNPAVLSTSGFVFCYTCIYQYVDQEYKCPVTDLPSSVDQIIKIYEST